MERMRVCSYSVSDTELYYLTLSLQMQDAVTSNMDVHEYLNYSECRLMTFRELFFLVIYSYKCNH